MLQLFVQLFFVSTHWASPVGVARGGVGIGRWYVCVEATVINTSVVTDLFQRGLSATRRRCKRGIDVTASNQARLYSNTIVSVPRTRLHLAIPTGRVSPLKSIQTSKSGIGRPTRRALEVNMFRECRTRESLAYRIVTNIGNVA